MTVVGTDACCCTHADMHHVPVRRVAVVRTVLTHRRLEIVAEGVIGNQVGQQGAWRSFLRGRTTKIRLGNVNPRIVNDSNSGGKVLFRGNVSCQQRWVIYLIVK